MAHSRIPQQYAALGGCCAVRGDEAYACTGTETGGCIKPAERNAMLTIEQRGTWFVPITPGGSPVIWGAGGRRGKLNAAQTEPQAWANLLEDAAHMPYPNKAAFIKRGYTVEKWEGFQP